MTQTLLILACVLSEKDYGGLCQQAYQLLLLKRLSANIGKAI